MIKNILTAHTKKIRFLARFIFGIIILIFLLYSVDPASVAAVILSINPLFLVFALLLYAVTFLILSFRWRFILRRMGYAISWKTAYRAFAAGVLVSDLTPARIGELSRPLAIRNQVPVQAGMISVLADRYLDILVIFVLGSIGLLFISKACDIPLFPVLLILILLLATPVILLSIDRKHVVRIAGFLGSARLNDLVRSLDEIISHTHHLPTLLGTGILLTIISWVLQAARIMVICFATGYPVPLGELIVVQPLISALSLVPVSIAGLGLVEGGYAAMLSLFGVPVATGMAIALLDRFLTVVFHLAVGGRTAAAMI
ncbi:MAG: flippase-like domain-containing protein [Methanospirillaceae archaeon]|nr:flippase-like domain-containing protein [Methanospirillaceae archaeon]